MRRASRVVVATFRRSHFAQKPTPTDPIKHVQRLDRPVKTRIGRPETWKSLRRAGATLDPVQELVRPSKAGHTVNSIKIPRKISRSLKYTCHIVSSLARHKSCTGAPTADNKSTAVLGGIGVDVSAKDSPAGARQLMRKPCRKITVDSRRIPGLKTR